MRKNLTKNQIIRRKSDISRIFKEGKVVSVRGYKLVYSPNGLYFPRIIIIPAKKFGNAVQRNTVRRRCKEIFRMEYSFLEHGYDVAFIIYPGNEYDYTICKKQFCKLVEKAGLFI